MRWKPGEAEPRRGSARLPQAGSRGASEGGATAGGSGGAGFWRSTSYSRYDMPAGPRPQQEADSYTSYRHAQVRVQLPEPQREEGRGLWSVLQERRSERGFSREALELAELGQLLWAVNGITAQMGQHLFRTAASAGALYPNETYLVVNRVKDCPPGVAHYDVRHHALEVLRVGEFGSALALACLGQGFCKEAAAVFCWAAVVGRATWKYGDRAYRYIPMDAGHLGAHLQLAATAQHLGSVNIGAFYDDEVNAIFGLDGQEETAVYLAAVGRM